MLEAARLGQQHAGALEKHQLGWDTGTGVLLAWWGGEMRSNLARCCQLQSPQAH